MNNSIGKLEPKKKRKLKIRLLKCHRSSEINGDEVYLKYNGRRIWPMQSHENIHSSGELIVNTEILIEEPENFTRIDLWESDLLLDDHLGSFVFTVDGSSGEYATDLTSKNKDEAYRYSLVWGV